MKLYTEEHGSGHPLLLITGLGYAIWSWQRQIPDWSQHFTCVAVDNRGTGRSPKPPGPYSIEQLADDAAGALEGRRAHVTGFSMGGYIAQTLALRHPDLVERLVLVCTGTGGPDYAPFPEETAAAWTANAHKPPPEFARASMPLSFAPGWTDEHPDEFETLLRDRLEYPTPPECWRAQFDSCNAFIRKRTPVEEIAAPTRAPAVHRGCTEVQRDGRVVPDGVESGLWIFATRRRRPRSARSCARGSSPT